MKFGAGKCVQMKSLRATEREEQWRGGVEGGGGQEDLGEGLAGGATEGTDRRTDG